MITNVMIFCLTQQGIETGFIISVVGALSTDPSFFFIILRSAASFEPKILGEEQ